MGLGICIFGFFILLSFMMKAPIQESLKEPSKGYQAIPPEVSIIAVENEVLVAENHKLLRRIAELESK
jgi:hypothetical protein